MMDRTEDYEEDTLDSKPLVSDKNIPFGPRHGRLVWKTLQAFLVILPLVTIGSFSNSPHGTITNQLVYRSFGGITKDSHGGSNITGNQSTCVASTNKTSENDIQQEASNFILYMQIGSCLAGCVFVPFWGALSDHLGRHVIVFAVGMGAIIRVVSMLVLSINPSAPKWILILGDTLHACFGRSSSGLIMACAAIIADDIPQGKRTFMMITVDFCFLLSATASQFITGYWIKQSGFTPILITCLTGHVLILFYGVLIMPRISKSPIDPTFQEAPFCKKLKMYFVRPYRTYFMPRENFARICLLLIVLFTFLEAMGKYGIDFLLTLYALGPPLCWDSVLLGIFNGVQVALNGTVPMVIGLFMIKCKPSSWLIALGLLGGTVSSIVYGFAVTNALMFVGVAILSPRILVPSVSRSFLADLTSETEHGAVMSGYVLVGVIAELLAHSTFNRIYNATIATCSQCFFFFSSVFYFIAMLVLGCFAVANRKNNRMQKAVKILNDPEWPSG